MSEQESILGGVEVAPGVIAPHDALRMQFSRSGGPGGQNVNKLSTRAELWLQLSGLRGISGSAIERLKVLAGRRLTAAGEIHLVSESERGQEGNRAAVMQRLREMIVQARVEPKIRRKTKPSRSSKAKRLATKKRRGTIKSMRRAALDD